MLYRYIRMFRFTLAGPPSMIGIQFAYSFIYVDFSVALGILIDLLFNLSTRNGR